MSDDGLSLADIVEDLRQILEAARDDEESGSPASYDAIQTTLSDELDLHILSYIRFLEDQDFLVYDRIEDQLTVPEAGLQALAAPEAWQHEVQQAFAEHIAESSEDAAMDDLLGEMDEGLLDDIAAGLDDPSSVGSNGLAQEDSQPTMVLDGAAAGQSFGGDVAEAAPADLSAPDPAPFEPDALASEAPTHTPEKPTHHDAKDERATMSKQHGSYGDRQRGAVSRSSSSAAGLYSRLDEIGSGGVGTVWRANQVKLDRPAALKEINKVFNVFAGVKRDDIIASFTEVVQSQAQLVHPNIVQVIDIETDVEFPYVVTQYAPRGNLRRLIEMDERPSLSVALKYFLQILSALQTAHAEDIIHGNLKPENVILDAAGNAMLSDFGLSSIVEREGGNSSHVYVGVGTVAYMSPEQFQNPNSATVKSDIYSLGIMFYEMLTGKVPGRRSPMPSSFFPDIPRKLDDIFDRMSMDAQEDRYDSVQQILTDLYEAEEVMEMLDNRSAVLFLRDPIEFGELGGMIGGAPPTAGGAGLDESSVSEAGLEESSVSEAEDDAEADEQDGDDADEISEVEVDEDVEGDDVLDKLDKYGDMFEEEEEA